MAYLWMAVNKIGWKYNILNIWNYSMDSFSVLLLVPLHDAFSISEQG
jgi:hypothetical protein